MSTTTWSTINRIGLVLTTLIALVNIPSVLEKVPPGQPGPPYGVLVADTILGVIALIAVIPAWMKANRTGALVACVANILSALTTVPAYFAGVSNDIKLIVTVFIVVTVLSVVLTLAKARTTSP